MASRSEVRSRNPAPAKRVPLACADPQTLNGALRLELPPGSRETEKRNLCGRVADVFPDQFDPFLKSTSMRAQLCIERNNKSPHHAGMASGWKYNESTGIGNTLVFEKQGARPKSRHPKVLEITCTKIRNPRVSSDFGGPTSYFRSLSRVGNYACSANLGSLEGWGHEIRRHFFRPKSELRKDSS